MRRTAPHLLRFSAVSLPPPQFALYVGLSGVVSPPGPQQSTEKAPGASERAKTFSALFGHNSRRSEMRQDTAKVRLERCKAAPAFW